MESSGSASKRMRRDNAKEGVSITFISKWRMSKTNLYCYIHNIYLFNID